MRNLNITQRNKSGFVGVKYESLVRRTGRRWYKHDYWTATFCIDGKQKHQRFSIKKLGEQKAKGAAIAARKKAIYHPSGRRK